MLLKRPTVLVRPQPYRYMSRMAKPKTSAERVKTRRAKLRAMGLRPIQIWVPDTRAPGFAEECARQMRNIIAAQTDESRVEDNAWFALAAETWGEAP